jgi:hypothetical protein
MKRNFIFLILTFIILGCAKQGNKSYILMEKQIADLNNRHRTTAKIVIRSSFSVNRENIEKTLKEALSDLQKDDPELDAVIIWAYKDRKELNQTFTLGKLEWSKDKKGWDGKQKLDKEIILEVKR